MKSVHPFEPFAPLGATKLIIGSIPPSRFCKEPYSLYENDVQFYYGSRDNSFWKLLEEIAVEKLVYKNLPDSVDQRKRLLEKLGIGITDIVADCIHTNDSASDKNIIDIKYKDLKGLLKANPSIKTLIYTSEFVKTQVNKYLNTYH